MQLSFKPFFISYQPYALFAGVCHIKDSSSLSNSSEGSIAKSVSFSTGKSPSETGFVMFGKSYAYICVVRRNGQNYLEIRKGSLGGGADETLCQSQPYDDTYVTFQLSARYEEKNKLTYRFTFGGSAFTHKFYAEKGVWTGAKMGIYARSQEESKGHATFKFFRVTCTDNRYKNT